MARKKKKRTGGKNKSKPPVRMYEPKPDSLLALQDADAFISCAYNSIDAIGYSMEEEFGKEEMKSLESRVLMLKAIADELRVEIRGMYDAAVSEYEESRK